MGIGNPDTARIIAFLKAIGIRVTLAPVPDGSFLPGMAVRGGGLVVDPERPFWPGDLLHEAGHVAVTDPAARAGLDTIRDDPGEEMAAIAWSYAAAMAIGLDPRVLFHDHGYRGSGASLAENFAAGAQMGVPMLQYYGMSAEPHQAGRLGRAPYPRMTRWLR